MVWGGRLFFGLQEACVSGRVPLIDCQHQFFLHVSEQGCKQSTSAARTPGAGEAGALAVGYAGEHSVKGTRIMVYALGQWCVLLVHLVLLFVIPG